MWEKKKKKAFQKDQSIKSRDYVARILDTLASIQNQTKSYKTLQAMSRIPEAFSQDWTWVIPKLPARHFLTSKLSEWWRNPDTEVETQKSTVMSAGKIWCPPVDPPAN